MNDLHLAWRGPSPVSLTFAGERGVTVTARIEPDPEARPFWLGRLIKHPAPGAIRVGRGEWFEPAIPVRDLEAGFAPVHGKRKARLLARDRIGDDYRRLRRYGWDWTLYRLTVTVCRDGRELGAETIGGLDGQGLPLHDTALIETLARDLLARASASAAA